MGEETEEESFEELEEDFEGEVGEDIEADIDLGGIEDDEDFDDEDADEAAPRRSAAPSNKDDADLVNSSYEGAVKANPKRATKHQKRSRLIEGVLDTAELGTEEGAAKAWAALQKQAGDAQIRKYAMSEELTENDVIEHPKFGEGYVVEILTSTKVAVLFEGGVRKLAHNRS